MSNGLDQLIAAAQAGAAGRDVSGERDDVIVVSDTVSMAASVYEMVRNALEYDEEHLLRRNAIRRILKRSLGEHTSQEIADKLLRELIWAHYLPNKRVPESMIEVVSGVIEKYRVLFAAIRGESQEDGRTYDWVLDVLSTEVEYTLSPPRVEEALINLAYGHFVGRINWNSKVVAPADRELQVYIATLRTVLKSNLATLRFRVLTLYYPSWQTSGAADEPVAEVAGSLGKVIGSIEKQITHPGADAVLRLVRPYAIVFHSLRDAVQKDSAGFAQALAAHDLKLVDKAVGAAIEVRYKRFAHRRFRSVLRAVVFLLFTKTVIALAFELPYERLVIHATSWTPLLSNIVFHPLLLGFIGLTVRVPSKKNTAKVLDEVHGLLGAHAISKITYKGKRGWGNGALGVVFKTLYAAVFLLSIIAIVAALRSFDFNGVSIIFFIFFLSLVTFFGLKVRNTKRELVVLKDGGGWFSTLIDILFLPMIRAGRWISLRAPRVNVFLFFFDFIIEAPFKAAIRMVEGWLAFLKEKKEEI